MSMTVPSVPVVTVTSFSTAAATTYPASGRALGSRIASGRDLPWSSRRVLPSG